MTDIVVPACLTMMMIRRVLIDTGRWWWPLTTVRWFALLLIYSGSDQRWRADASDWYLLSWVIIPTPLTPRHSIIIRLMTLFPGIVRKALTPFMMLMIVDDEGMSQIADHYYYSNAVSTDDIRYSTVVMTDVPWYDGDIILTSITMIFDTMTGKYYWWCHWWWCHRYDDCWFYWPLFIEHLTPVFILQCYYRLVLTMMKWCLTVPGRKAMMMTGIIVFIWYCWYMMIFRPEYIPDIWPIDRWWYWCVTIFIDQLLLLLFWCDDMMILIFPVDDIILILFYIWWYWWWEWYWPVLQMMIDRYRSISIDWWWPEIDIPHYDGIINDDDVPIEKWWWWLPCDIQYDMVLLICVWYYYYYSCYPLHYLKFIRHFAFPKCSWY